ncbi:hypothetical protein PINS_up001413 [Pythium insidiosum]|nr:hypothetical protein PINS_up001413 [Pythium insidiosum]
MDASLAGYNDLRARNAADVSGANGRQRPVEDTRQRNERVRRSSTFTPSLLSNLPRQGGKSLCMKFLSVAGCTGNGSGGCFDPRRAHFRPKTGDLRSDAREVIIKQFQGFSAEFADL